jgi:hypothetical protein
VHKNMNASLRTLYLLILLSILLSSCTDVRNPSADDVMRNLQKTNLYSSQFPWIYGVADGKTKRWDIEHDGLIPVKLNGSALAQDAIEKIESFLQMPIFDTTSIANLSDERITRGIIVSEGTTVGPNGAITKYTCGNVSALPDTTDYPQNFYDANGNINTRLYVNLSSKKCAASLEITIHEFGHALGLGDHFPGFGSGDIISPSFWQVLYTLYHNKVGTSAEDLQIQLLDKQW